MSDKSIPSPVRGSIDGIDSRSDVVVYFGPDFSTENIERARRADMFVFSPGEHTVSVTRKQIVYIQAGVDEKRGTQDDVIVVGYVTI